MVKQNISCFILACVIAVLSTGCEAPETENLAEADLRVAVPVGLEALPLIAALEGGYFEEVRVDLVPIGGRIEQERLLQSGAVDGAVGCFFSVVGLQGQSFITMAVSTSAADYWVVANPGGIDSISGLAGATVAVCEDACDRYLLDALLQRYDLDPAGPERCYTVDAVKALEALELKKADAAFLPRHLGEEALRNGALILGSTLEQDLMAGVILFSGEALLDKEQQVRAFYRGYQKAVAGLNRGEREILLPLVEKWGFPGEWVEAVVISMPRMIDRDEVNDLLAWLKTAESFEAAPLFESLVWRYPLWD
jgi:NitT/TauT family transport system substrate-binding protein